MDLKEEAIAKDSILKFMLANPLLKREHGDQPRTFQPMDFIEIDFGRNLDFSTMERLVEQITFHNKEVVNHSHDLFVECNNYTQQFLDEGGFVGIYDQEQKDIKATKDAELVARKKDREQLTILKWQKNTFWIVCVLGLVGGVYSLYKISQAIFTPSNDATEEQLNS